MSTLFEELFILYLWLRNIGNHLHNQQKSWYSFTFATRVQLSSFPLPRLYECDRFIFPHLLIPSFSNFLLSSLLTDSNMPGIFFSVTHHSVAHGWVWEYWHSNGCFVWRAQFNVEQVYIGCMFLISWFGKDWRSSSMSYTRMQLHYCHAN